MNKLLATVTMLSSIWQEVIWHRDFTKEFYGQRRKCYGWKKLLHINLEKVHQLDGKNKKILNLYEKFL